jgi:hypothetical protein
MKIKIALLFALSILSNILSAQTFTQHVKLNCGDSIFISPLGYPTWNDPKILKRPIWGHAILLGDFVAANNLRYSSPPCFAGNDTVIIQCARATQITCDTGIYIFEVSCVNTLPDFSSHEVDCLDSIYVNDLNAFSMPMIEEGPFHGTARIILEPTDGAGVFYTPMKQFEGLDYVKVKLRSGVIKLYIFNMYCNLKSKVDDEPTVNFHLWPNPSTSEILINLPFTIVDIQCYSLEGQKVDFPYTPFGTTIVSNVSLLQPGTYTVHIITQTKTYVKKFIKI